MCRYTKSMKILELWLACKGWVGLKTLATGTLPHRKIATGSRKVAMNFDRIERVASRAWFAMALIRRGQCTEPSSRPSFVQK